MTENINDVVHHVRIEQKDTNYNIVKVLLWKELPWEIRTKYDWYFKYRAALLQVQNPRHHIEFTWGNKPASGESLQRITTNKIIRKKGQITEFKRKLSMAEKTWNYLFPIKEDKDYIRAVEKTKKLQLELDELQNSLNN